MVSARTLSAVALVALIAGAVPGARALDMPLAGRKLGMRGGERPRLVLVTRDRISAPAPGLADDPTVAGGRLEIGNPDTGEWAAFELSAAGWTFDETGTRFRFREPTPRDDGSRVQRLVLRHRTRLRLRMRSVGLTLDEGRQGTIAVVLTLGSRRYCAVFGGTVTRDEPGRFSALDAPAPAACPQRVTVSTTSTSVALGSSSSTSSSSSSTSTSATSTSTATGQPTSTSSTTTTSSSSTSTAEPTTTSSTSTSSTTEEPTSTSSSSSSSSTVEDTTTSSTSSSETSTSTSSTTTSTDFTCGGTPPLACGGTCPPGQTCGGLFACECG